MWILSRVSQATATIFFSFILATISLILIGVRWPGIIAQIQDWSDVLEHWITSTALPEKYNIWLRFLVDDTTFVVMFFTIMARMVLAIVVSGLQSAFGGGSERY